jgi:hypothetical protein
MELLFTFEASDDASNAVFVGALIMNDYYEEFSVLFFNYIGYYFYPFLNVS